MRVYRLLSWFALLEISIYTYTHININLVKALNSHLSKKVVSTPDVLFILLIFLAVHKYFYSLNKTQKIESKMNSTFFFAMIPYIEKAKKKEETFKLLDNLRR